MKKGAADFLPKPFSLDHLMAVVRKALEVQSLREENVLLKEELGRRYQFENIVGYGARMQEILGAVSRVAPSRTTVLLCGESGVIPPTAGHAWSRSALQRPVNLPMSRRCSFT